jgi:Bacterial regulatory proteins, tetR family.
MKRKTTKEILAESFRELAADRAIDKITVQEIVSNCAYSSATFYRHFKDKYDLIAWDYAQNAAEIMNRLNEKDYIWGQVLLDWAAYFQQEKEYLMNLLLHTSGHDAFIPDALFSLLQKNRACVIIVLTGDLFFYPCSFQTENK